MSEREEFEKWMMVAYREEYQSHDFSDVLRVFTSGKLFGEYINTTIRDQEKSWKACAERKQREIDKLTSQLNKIQALFNSGDWSVLRCDGLMTLPYNEAEKIAEELQDFLVNFEKP